MTQESRLAITIDSRGAKRSADDLTSSLEKMERAGDVVTSTTEGLSSSLDDQRKELSQLLGQINPTVAALGRLDDMQERLAKFKKAGIVESDTFVEYTQRINTMRQALSDTSIGMSRAGMSAKAYSAALRGLPAQFTDIAVSLQAGQAPLTVFLQQGGQLKDMFGGAGPAARAMGGYILGLVNPLTVAAGSAAALGLAFYDAEKEVSAFNRSLFSGAANSGQTTESLAQVAKSAAAITGDLSDAKSAVIALAASGRASEVQFRNLAQTSTAIAKFTGQAADDVARSFGGIGDSATKAAQKISEQYGLVTAAQYEVIAGLESQGKKQEALDALSESLNANAQGRLQRYRDSLSELERDWDDVGTAISNAYSKVKAGLFPDDNKQIEIAQRILDTRKAGGFTGALSNLFSFGDNTNQALRAQIKTLTERREAAAAAAKAEADETNANQGRIAAAARWASSQLEYLDKESRKRSEIAEARELGLKAGRSEEEIAKRIASIESKYAEKTKAKAFREDNRGVAEATNAFARLYAQYDPAAQAARALTEEQQQLDLAFQKGKISQEEYGKALAQASLNYSAIVQGQDQHLARLKLINDQYVKGQSLAELYAQAAAATGMQGPAGKIAQAGIDASINSQIFSGKPNTSQIDAVIGGAGSELMRMTQENEQLQAWYDQRIAMYQQYRELEVENAAQYDETIRQLEKQRAADTLNNERSMSVARLSLAEGMFGDLTSIVGTFAGQQSGAYKAMFAVQKAASIAQSLVSIQTGIAMAAANPFPLNLAAMASVAAATASIVGNIQSVGLNLATGGYVRGPGTGTSDSIPARLSNGEFVVNAEATKRNRSLLEAINSNERVSVSGGGGRSIVRSGNGRGGERDRPVRGDISLSFNVSVQAQPGMSDAEARRQAQQIADGTTDLILQVLQNEKRPGGLLS